MVKEGCLKVRWGGERSRCAGVFQVEGEQGAVQAEVGGGSDHPACPCRDLLGQEPQEKLEIRLCPDGSGQLYVPGLTEFQVQSVADINKVQGWGAWGGSGSAGET